MKTNFKASDIQAISKKNVKSQLHFNVQVNIQWNYL